MKALIDADIFQWEFGSATDSEYRPIPWPFVQSRVQARIDHIIEASGADDHQLYLTADDKSNFRYKVATIKPYKGHRKQEKPYWYNHIRNFLVDHRGAIEVFGMEADDAIAMEQYKNGDRTIICSRDKDLTMVPGWHFSWGIGGRDDKGPYYITEVDGLRSFYCQLLTGDVTDNILGLYGVGSTSKLLDRVRSCDSELDMYNVVHEQYTKRFGSYAEKFLLENAQLLWMSKEKPNDWKPPTE